MTQTDLPVLQDGTLRLRAPCVAGRLVPDYDAAGTA